MQDHGNHDDYSTWCVQKLPNSSRGILPSIRGEPDRPAKVARACNERERRDTISSQSPLVRLFRLLLLCDEGLVHALHHHVAAEDALRRHVPVQLRLQDRQFGERERRPPSIRNRRTQNTIPMNPAKSRPSNVKKDNAKDAMKQTEHPYTENRKKRQEKTHTHKHTHTNRGGEGGEGRGLFRQIFQLRRTTVFY